MKFVKGMIIGTLVSTGAYMMYMESSNKTKKKIMQTGKQMVRKMGLM